MYTSDLIRRRIFFVLWSSKTHGKHMDPQLIKISSVRNKNKNKTQQIEMPCPYDLIHHYAKMWGGYKKDNEPFFRLSDGTAIKPAQFNLNLRMFIKFAGFNEKLYSSHSLRTGRSCDLYKLDLSVETIMKIGRWCSNSVYRYLKM